MSRKSLLSPSVRFLFTSLLTLAISFILTAGAAASIAPDKTVWKNVSPASLNQEVARLHTRRPTASQTGGPISAQTVEAAASHHTIYVSVAGNDTFGTGAITSPYRSLTKGLSVAVYTDEIDAGPGIYSTATTGETMPLNLKNGVHLFGAGPLSSTIKASGTRAVQVSSCDANTALAGFKITGGDATDGGGIEISNSGVVVIVNYITGNSATLEGAGISCVGSICGPIIAENLIASNGTTDPASRLGGGGIATWDSAWPLIENNLIVKNSAYMGGGIYYGSGSPLITGNTIRENAATLVGGGVNGSTGLHGVFNSIIWDNTAAGAPNDVDGFATSYCDVNVPLQASSDGNINAAPVFVSTGNPDVLDDDYSLRRGSPGIDAGIPISISLTDFDGTPRPQGGGFDMGAYEKQPEFRFQALYDYGSATSRIWVFNNFNDARWLLPHVGWYGGTGAFDANRVKTVNGDFDRDERTDIAMLYDYGAATSRLWIFDSIPGDTCFRPTVAWAGGTGTFDASRVKLTSGDYNGDGLTDIAMLYDYGAATSRLWIFRATGLPGTASFAPAVAWSGGAGAFDANRVKLTSGDFNGDTLDDIAMLYDYGSATSRLWVLHAASYSPGIVAFAPPAVAWSSAAGAFDANRVQLVSGDFNGNTQADIAMLYNNGAGARLWLFNAIGTTSDNSPSFVTMSAWSSGAFDASRVKMSAGDYDVDGKADIGMLYDYGSATSRMWTFTAVGSPGHPTFDPSAVWYSGPGGFDANRAKLIN